MEDETFEQFKKYGPHIVELYEDFGNFLRKYCHKIDNSLLILALMQRCMCFLYAACDDHKRLDEGMALTMNLAKEEAAERLKTAKEMGLMDENGRPRKQ